MDRPETPVIKFDGHHQYTEQEWKAEGRKFHEQAVKEWAAMTAEQRGGYGFNDANYVAPRVAALIAQARKTK